MLTQVNFLLQTSSPCWKVTSLWGFAGMMSFSVKDQEQNGSWCWILGSDLNISSGWRLPLFWQWPLLFFKKLFCWHTHKGQCPLTWHMTPCWAISFKEKSIEERFIAHIRGEDLMWNVMYSVFLRLWRLHHVLQIWLTEWRGGLRRYADCYKSLMRWQLHAITKVIYWDLNNILLFESWIDCHQGCKNSLLCRPILCKQLSKSHFCNLVQYSCVGIIHDIGETSWGGVWFHVSFCMNHWVFEADPLLGYQSSNLLRHVLECWSAFSILSVTGFSLHANMA